MRAILTACIISAFSLSAHADFYIHHWEDRHVPHRSILVTPSAAYYFTRSNFDESGTGRNITNLDSYSRLQADLDLSWGITDRLTAFGRVGWSWMSVSPLTGTESVSSYGFADQTLGANYTLVRARSGFELNAQAQIDFPLYNNANFILEGLPVPGDQSTDLTGGLFASYPLDSRDRHWRVQAGAGYLWRTGGYSQAVPWTAGIQYDPFREGFFFDLRGTGLLSLGTDPTTNLATAGQGAGGSYFINAINPSIFRVRGSAGYRFTEKLALRAFADHALLGASVPSGTHGGLAFQIDLGAPPVTGDPARMTPTEYGQSNQGFVNYAFQASVTRVNDRLNMVKIDKGSKDGVKVGQIFDIFILNKDGTVGPAVARAKIASVRQGEAVLKIQEYFKEVWIEEGFIVKRPLD